MSQIITSGVPHAISLLENPNVLVVLEEQTVRDLLQQLLEYWVTLEELLNLESQARSLFGWSSQVIEDKLIERVNSEKRA